jgi:hypothetical protein
MVMLLPKPASSQKVLFSLGAELAFPAGNYMEVGKSGFGGFVQMEHPWSKHVSGLLSVGYVQFGSNETNKDIHQQFSAMPVQFGIKYYTKQTAIHPAGFYLSGVMGVTGEFYDVTISYTDYYNTTKVDSHHDDYLGFCNTLGMGYQWGIVDAGFRFQTIISTNSGYTSYYNFRMAFTIR